MCVVYALIEINYSWSIYGTSPRPPKAPMENFAACNFFATACNSTRYEKSLDKKYSFLTYTAYF